MSYVFIDESGQFTKRSNEPIFVLGSFITDAPRVTEKQFRSWLRTKFPRVMRNQAEIKWSDAKIGEKLRLRTIAFIAKLGVRIRHVYLKSENIPINYWERDTLKSGELYTHVVGENLELYIHGISHEFRVICDQRNLKGITRVVFCRTLARRLEPVLPINTRIQVEMKDSTSSANLQIADWIAGALAAYYNKKPSGDKYFQALQNNFLSVGRELFIDNWIPQE